MEVKKRMGIWMDYATAHLIHLATQPGDDSTLVSNFTYEEKLSVAGKGKSWMHTKEAYEQLSYYKKLGEAIKNYNSVLLFGPTTAKMELLNLLHSSPQFAGIRIETKHTDKMTANQRYAFVKDHFKSRWLDM